ncbi:Wzz/FepE/Etk N-terminal domain-containing protein [Cognatishimia sp. SS12]|uniref:GumC family protein n=1 Tax=Cognatishimia sp. SS12 TaxID=2979465 RepID=UPI00232BD4E4|nr:Wzz/FepE/Etk N-terminal domain-containing protein [Cognatishimia sp. SS12]MDC0736822.1 Wzz/FepE/Etk N-terminal domain-containing protein [Cognatishimia sp. SS12]
MNRLATLDEVISAVLRHIVLLAVVVAIGVVASLFYALSLPREYETSAVIQIEQPQVQAPNLSGVSSVNAQTLQQLQIIEQRVMSRDNLLAIIKAEGLFAAEADLTDNQKVAALRRSASVIRISDPALAWRPDVIPTAMNITVRLGDPEVATRVANTLVDNVLEENRSRRALRASETLAFFESEEQRLGTEIEALEARISEFKRNNADSLDGGLAVHREELALLEQEKLAVDREIIQLTSSTRGTRNSVAQNRIEQLEEQRQLLEARIDRVRVFVESAPEAERELSGLERALMKLTDQYQVITRNQAEAEMGAMLEASQQSESFRVLERAVVPDYPIAPNRKMIALMGCILSGLAGLALIAVLELRNPVIRTERQLERHLALRAVAVIPTVHVAHEKARSRVFWGLGIALAVVGFVLVAAYVSAR